MLIKQDSITEMNIECGQPGKDLMSMKEYLALQKTMLDSSWPVHPLGAVSDTSFLGFMVKTSDKKFRIQLGCEFDSAIYRGQNKDYDFVPSLQRPNITNDPVKFCEQWIKKEQFKRCFTKTPYYEWMSQMKAYGNAFDIDLEAIAQHYGFCTDYLDTTTDFNIALYFAYTCTDSNGRTVPITDFSEYSPTLYVAKSFELCEFDCPVVGFQATLRPLMQRAMAVKIEPTQDVKSRFKKIELPKDPIFAEGVFNSYHKGVLLMPGEIISLLAKKVLGTKLVPDDLLKLYCRQHHTEYAVIRQSLRTIGYDISDEDIGLTDAFIQSARQEIIDYMLPFVKNNISHRGSTPAVKNFG